MNEQILAALARYGFPALFTVVTVASVGVPLPVTLLLVVTGSLAAQSVLNLWIAIALAAVGSCAGDQLGYAIGHWGGKTIAVRIAGLLNQGAHLPELEARAGKLGGSGIFFSRWLVTPLGPWINFASGMANYSWIRFTAWDFAGELLDASLYIGLGYAFSDRVQAVAAVLGNLTWAILGALVAAFLGWKLFRKRPSALLTKPQRAAAPAR